MGLVQDLAATLMALLVPLALDRSVPAGCAAPVRIGVDALGQRGIEARLVGSLDSIQAIRLAIVLVQVSYGLGGPT